jgi:hypothetical protein
MRRSSATGYGLNDRVSGVRFPTGAGNFSLFHRVQTGSGAHPAPYPMGIADPSLEVKRPWREADNSSPSVAEVKNVWRCTFTPQYVFIAWCLVKHRNYFTFTLHSDRLWGPPNFPFSGLRGALLRRGGGEAAAAPWCWPLTSIKCRG